LSGPLAWRGVFDDRFAWAWLAAAMAVAFATIFWFGHGSTLGPDDLSLLIQSPGLDLQGALHPHDGHLVVVTRLVDKAFLEAFGASYLPFRILAASTEILTVGLLFAYMKRRVPPFAALAPCIVLLFFGSDVLHVLVSNAFTVLFSVSCGLAALLALERADSRGDIAAALLLCLGIATYSVALTFLAGAAVLIALDRARWRRIWVVALPLVLYGAWSLWAAKFASGPGNQAQLSHLLLLPAWGVQSLSAVFAALTGFDFPFPESGTEFRAGPVLAVLALIGLGLRLKRGSIPPTLWAALAVLVAVWGLGVLTGGTNRAPDSPRYLYSGAIIVLMAAAACAAGLRWPRAALVSLYAVAACGFGVNLYLLHERGFEWRNGFSTEVKAGFAAVDLAGSHAPATVSVRVPEGEEFAGVESPLNFIFGSVGETGRQPVPAYLAAAERYGSIGYSLAEVRAASDPVRAQVDAALVSALELELRPGADVPTGASCRTAVAAGDGQARAELPRGGAVLEAKAGGTVKLRRFAQGWWFKLGDLSPGKPAVLRIPADAAADPWWVSAATPSLRVCALR